MKRPLLALLFCCACLGTTFTSRHAAVRTPTATTTTYTEDFDNPQYGIYQTSNVIDGTDYWNHGYTMLNGDFQ